MASRGTKAFVYAAFWLLLAGVGYLAIDTVIAPKVASAVIVDGTGTVVIDRSYDQHFYVAGSINGHPVTFMVDTGASVVSVSEDLAGKIGSGEERPPHSTRSADGLRVGWFLTRVSAPAESAWMVFAWAWERRDGRRFSARIS
jgi:aspartyl protease family protein